LRKFSGKIVIPVALLLSVTSALAQEYQPQTSKRASGSRTLNSDCSFTGASIAFWFFTTGNSPFNSTNSSRNSLTSAPVEFTQTGQGVVLRVPPAEKGEIDRVIVLTLDETN
jgi:hypothetical protein